MYTQTHSSDLRETLGSLLNRLTLADAHSGLRSLLYRGSPKPLIIFNLANPRARLSLISRHLEGKSDQLQLNTPFSTERLASRQDDPEYTPLAMVAHNMASHPGEDALNQPKHPTLLIPGPVEFDDAVLGAMSHYRCGPPRLTSHASH